MCMVVISTPIVRTLALNAQFSSFSFFVRISYELLTFDVSVINQFVFNSLYCVSILLAIFIHSFNVFIIIIVKSGCSNIC